MTKVPQEEYLGGLKAVPPPRPVEVAKEGVTMDEVLTLIMKGSTSKDVFLRDLPSF